MIERLHLARFKFAANRAAPILPASLAAASVHDRAAAACPLQVRWLRIERPRSMIERLQPARFGRVTNYRN
jgi:hypothetical protein